MKAKRLRQEQIGREHDKVAQTEIETHLMEAGRLILMHHAGSNWQSGEIKAYDFQVDSQDSESEANCDS